MIKKKLRDVTELTYNSRRRKKRSIPDLN